MDKITTNYVNSILIKYSIRFKLNCNMKKILTIALMAMIAVSASAAKKKEAAKDANKPVFTVIKENPITTIKDQNRSGTCWDYSTLSFF